LGMPWLERVNPAINWRSKIISASESEIYKCRAVRGHDAHSTSDVHGCTPDLKLMHGTARTPEMHGTARHVELRAMRVRTRACTRLHVW